MHYVGFKLIVIQKNNSPDILDPEFGSRTFILLLEALERHNIYNIQNFRALWDLYLASARARLLRSSKVLMKGGIHRNLTYISEPKVSLPSISTIEEIDLNIYTPACLAKPGDSFTGRYGWTYGELHIPTSLVKRRVKGGMYAGA